MKPKNLYTPRMRRLIRRQIAAEDKLTKDGPLAVVAFYRRQLRHCPGCKSSVHVPCYLIEVKTPGIFCGLDWACASCLFKYVTENIAESKVLARVNRRVR